MHTKASGISFFSRLTNMSLHNALFNPLCFVSALPIALAASFPYELPLSLRTSRFSKESICEMMSPTAE